MPQHAERNGETERCPGCSAEVPKSDGPTHAYIGASPGCWAIFGQVMAREYGEYGYPSVHRLTVDAYAAQHPGTSSRRSIQSVAAHLISLHLLLQRGYDADRATQGIRDALVYRSRFVWLEPPAALGALTILDVHGAADLTAHVDRVDRWARAVWEAWAPHHATIQRWAGR